MRFGILGPLEVVVDERPMVLVRRKQRVLLARLLVQPNRVVSLDALVDALWGANPPVGAIGSVQAYVSHLRRVLEPGRTTRGAAEVVVSQRPGYRLVVATGDLDATQFEALAATGRQLLERGEHGAAADALHEGLGLWRGPVLADISDAPFPEAERTRLEQLRLAAHEDAAAADLELGRHAAVAARLEHLVADHPFHESLHGLRMLALYRAGRQAEALQAYRHAQRVLHDELGIDPGPQLRRLEALILQQSPELAWSPPPPSAVRARSAPEPTGPAGGAAGLVGRERELGALGTVLARAAAGESRTALVSGEPGIGKTRLVEELARRAERDGFEVVWGRCREEEEGAPPFWPWRQVVHGLLAGVGTERLDALLGADASEVVLLVPELREVLPAAAPAAVFDVAAVRFGVCRAVTGLVRRSAELRPLLLVLDDLHWADAASLQLLATLGSRSADVRLLVVATYRPGEPDPAGALGDVLAALARESSVERVALGGLVPDEVAQMMAAELSAEADAQLARLVHDRTDGNPFYVTELLRLLQSEGRLSRTPAEARVAAAVEIPAGVRDVLRRRLARLPEQTRAVLLVASVIGRAFDLGTVASVTGLDDDRALEAVETAMLSGLVVEEEETVGRFRFAHALVREVVYADVGRLRRARLHARVAAAMGEVAVVDQGERVLLVARHWSAAADVVDADVVVPHLLTGADEALRRLAHEEADHHLRRALHVLARTPLSPKRTRDELAVHLRLGAVSAQLDGAAAPSTWAAVTTAGQLAEALGDDAATVAAHRGLYEVAVARAEHDAARRLADRMLVVAQRSRDPALLTVAHLGLGRTLWCSGDPVGAYRHLERAQRLAATASEVPHEPLPVALTVDLQLAPVLDLLGRADEAEDTLARAVAHAADLAVWTRAAVLTSAALVSALARRLPSARTHAAEALRLAGGVPAWTSYATVVLSWTRSLDRDPGADVSLLRKGLREVQAGGAQHLVPWGLGLLAEAELLEGRPAVALQHLDQALSRVASTGERMGEAELLRLRAAGLLAADDGSLAGARAALVEAVAVATRQGSVALVQRAEEDLHRLLTGRPPHRSDQRQPPDPTAP